MDRDQWSPRVRATLAGCAAAIALPTAVHADDASDLAKKLSNPVAALISVPFQFNYDHDIGPERDGDRVTMNFQPVVPMSISEDWNLISRTIVPVTSQDDIFPGAGSQTGLGDTVQSFFFSPKAPTSGGLIWGAGPVLLVPTATDDLLGSKKWGLGPTAVLLKQSHGWTYGVLANHIWSVASVHGNNDDRPDISNTFLQPFLSYTTPTAWTYGVNTESTYDWKNEQWSVPLNFTIGKLTKLGSTPVSFTGGLRYWADSPDGGPHGWGVRFVVTLLFPK